METHLFLTYRWIFFIGIALGAAFLAHVLLRFLFRKLQNHLTGTHSTWKKSFVTALRPPAFLLLWGITISYVADILSEHYYSVDILKMTKGVKAIVIIIFISWFLLRWQKEVQGKLLKSLDPSHSHERAKLHIFGRMITLGIILMGLFLAFQVLGVNLQTLLTLGGVGGLALGIAGRDIFANIFSGVMIYITQPFILGDLVRSPERQIEGHIEEIGWYYTCIRGFNKQPLYVPNSIFSTIVIVNSSRMSHWRIEEMLGIRYKDFNALRPLMGDLQAMLDGHAALDQALEHSVFFDRFDNSSLNIRLVAYTKRSNDQEMRKKKQDILLKTGEILTRHGVEFAFPTITLDYDSKSIT